MDKISNKSVSEGGDTQRSRRFSKCSDNSCKVSVQLLSSTSLSGDAEREDAGEGIQLLSYPSSESRISTATSSSSSSCLHELSPDEMKVLLDWHTEIKLSRPLKHLQQDFYDGGVS
jgi:hypothetical protein